MIREGEQAPDFTLESDAGEQVSLADLRGKPVVLYFYPKDYTPGCTAQAEGSATSTTSSRRPARSYSASHPTASRHAKFKNK